MCEASWRAANSGRSQRMRCNTLPLFTQLPRAKVFSESSLIHEGIKLQLRCTGLLSRHRTCRADGTVGIRAKVYLGTLVVHQCRGVRGSSPTYNCYATSLFAGVFEPR